MGRSRYNCLHCNVSFPYTPLSRKKHFSGAKHQQIVRRFYDQYITAAERWRREVSRTVCRHYRKTGFCKYGDNCCNSHTQPAQLDALKRLADLEEYGPPPPPALEVVDAAAVAAFLEDMDRQICKEV